MGPIGTETNPLTTRKKNAGLERDVPRLENGDKLTRPEFERRYEAMPNVKKAELIEGVVYMPSPVRQVQHGRPHAHLIGWLSHYLVATPGLDIGDNPTLRLDLDNEPQPDVLLRIEGGTSRIDEDGYIEGPPELAVEVTSSSVAMDLHAKKQAYRRNGVQEYLVWLVQDQEIRWFRLHEGSYETLLPGEDGLLRSQVFPGLWLDEQALLAGDLAKVLNRLQSGLATPEHAAFRAQLAARRPT